MMNPGLISVEVKNELKQIGLWDLNPRNLFRITWKNEPKAKGPPSPGQAHEPTTADKEPAETVTEPTAAVAQAAGCSARSAATRSRSRAA